LRAENERRSGFKKDLQHTAFRTESVVTAAMSRPYRHDGGKKSRTHISGNANHPAQTLSLDFYHPGRCDASLQYTYPPTPGPVFKIFYWFSSLSADMNLSAF